jgi:hypothetical protein
MDAVYVFIIRNDVWIYILCAFGIFWYTSELIRAQSMLRRAMFNLERETGQRIRNNALFFMALLLSVVGGVYYINHYVAPTLPATALSAPTPTPDPLETVLMPPTPQPIPSDVEEFPGPLPVAPTVTLPSASSPAQPDTPPDTGGQPPPPPPPPPVDEPTPTPFVGCTAQLRIEEPADNSTIDAPITFFGTANTANFSYYELEANGPETGGSWANLLGRRIDQPVVDGFLGNVDLRGWQSGPYLIRLATYDNIGAQIGVCVIQVTLAND